MPGSLSSNAMAAKAKAMYGKRLKESDYQELLRRRGVNEIAAYLKNETEYRDILGGINEHAIHRGHLEMLVRQRFFLRFLKLIRYGETTKSSFYKYGVYLIEIKQILVTIRSFNDKDRSTQIAQMPIFAEKFASFDLEKLVSAADYDQLLEQLKNTPYYEVLAPLRPRTLDDLDYTACEIALKNVYYKQVNEIIDKEFSGTIKKQMQDIFNTQIELDNITKIYRLKKYYKSSASDIINVLNPTFQRIPQRLLYEWIETCDDQQFLQKIGESAYKNYIKNQNFVYIEYHMDTIHHNLNKHIIRFSSNPDLILVAYLGLLEVEIQNVIDIIEGVRYNVEIEKIAKMLIY
jgi:V/A-type H+/Na+-transporting ATPase subunit C